MDPIDVIRADMKKYDIPQKHLVFGGCGSAGHVSATLNRHKRLNVKFIRGFYKLCPNTRLDLLIEEYIVG